MEIPLYDPPGPVSEAFASHYVRRLIQRALDQAFKLSPPPARRLRRTAEPTAG